MSSVLRRAYVAVEPDVSEFDAKLREKFARTDPGGKAGKQLGGQLNRALKRLDLEPVDVRADPKKALAAIEATEAKLQALSRNASTVEIKVNAERALKQIGGFRKQLGDIGDDPGDDAAKGFASRFVAKVGPLLTSAPISPALLAAAVPAAPLIGGLIAGAVVGAAGVGGVVGGMTLAARDPRVKAAGQQLGALLLTDLQERSSAFVPATIAAIGRVRTEWGGVGDDLDRIFRSSRFVDPLVDGAITGGKKFMAGFADAIDSADPVIDAIAGSISQLGGATGELFTTMAEDADEGASAINDVTGALVNLIRVSGQVAHGFAEAKGGLDDFDVQLDKIRYAYEDWASEGIYRDLDITADGFKRGSKEALAYRDIVTGVGDATDVLALRTAGMTDAQIRSLDATGNAVDAANAHAEKERLRKAAIDESTGALDNMLVTEGRLKDIQAELTKSQDAYKRSLDQLNPSLTTARNFSDGLQQASEKLYGAAIAGAEANEAYQSSWDGLSSSVKANKGTLDLHTVAGRANRDSLQGLLKSNNDLYFANVASGDSTDSARKKHEQRTEAVRKESARLGLNKVETQKLIDTYGKIPDKKTTNIVQTGLQKIADQLEQVYYAQRALAEGKSISEVRKDAFAAKGGKTLFKGFGDGGFTGNLGIREPAGIVHGREFVLNADATAGIRRQAPGVLEEMNATGQVPGYGAGGFVAPVDTSRHIPMQVSLSGAYVMSLEKALAKVTPAFSGDWPSSPSAQRGDSGVWRRVVQLINSTGPLSGEFGNSYRPGDPLWHGSGRAVDWMGYNQDALASFLAAQRPLELIHRTRNRDYAYTRGQNRGSFNEGLMRAHENHIHVAMDDGGVRVLQPGMNLIPNGTGRPEPIAGPNAIASLAGGNTYHITVNVPATAHPAEVGRQVVGVIQAYEQTNGKRWRK